MALYALARTDLRLWSRENIGTKTIFLELLLHLPIMTGKVKDEYLSRCEPDSDVDVETRLRVRRPGSAAH